MMDIVKQLRSGYAATNMAHLKAADEIERNLEALRTLAKYFTSGNCIPVDQATIKADDFWQITGLDPKQHIQPTTKGSN